jgi:hypothetical protein
MYNGPEAGHVPTPPNGVYEHPQVLPASTPFFHTGNGEPLYLPPWFAQSPYSYPYYNPVFPPVEYAFDPGAIHYYNVRPDWKTPNQEWFPYPYPTGHVERKNTFDRGKKNVQSFCRHADAFGRLSLSHDNNSYSQTDAFRFLFLKNLFVCYITFCLGIPSPKKRVECKEEKKKHANSQTPLLPSSTKGSSKPALVFSLGASHFPPLTRSVSLQEANKKGCICFIFFS